MLTCSHPVRRHPTDCCKVCPQEERTTAALEHSDMMQADSPRYCKFGKNYYHNSDSWHPWVPLFGEMKCINCWCDVSKYDTRGNSLTLPKCYFYVIKFFLILNGWYFHYITKEMNHSFQRVQTKCIHDNWIQDLIRNWSQYCECAVCVCCVCVCWVIPQFCCSVFKVPLSSLYWLICLVNSLYISSSSRQQLVSVKISNKNFVTYVLILAYGVS